MALLVALAPGLAAAGPAAAQGIEISSAKGAVISISAASLAKLPGIEQDARFQTAKGVSNGHYKGALLWDVLKANGAIAETGHHDDLRQVFAVIGRDGYRIDFSVGEIAPEFGNKPMMIATDVDGKPIADGFRLVVPGDRLGARNVRDVVRIEIR
ncbi:MAG TPA: hypothetical protein VGM46_02315 [Mesorhizobium sp.]|jgi:hypothetical protein